MRTSKLHPATREVDNNWQDNISAFGPIGLLIESVVWNGLVPDQHLRVWQQREQPTDIWDTPYQLLNKQVHEPQGWNKIINDFQQFNMHEETTKFYIGDSDDEQRANNVGRY